jgi:hypothetical protein
MPRHAEGRIASAAFGKPHSFAELGKPLVGRLSTVPPVDTCLYPRDAGQKVDLKGAQVAEVDPNLPSLDAIEIEFTCPR